VKIRSCSLREQVRHLPQLLRAQSRDRAVVKLGEAVGIIAARPSASRHPAHDAHVHIGGTAASGSSSRNQVEVDGKIRYNDLRSSSWKTATTSF